MYDKQPLKPQLSGLGLEYRIVNLYSRDRGKREAVIGFNVGQGTQDLGFRNTVPILFDCQPAVKVVLGVKDSDGKPTTASFVVRDKLGHVYPNPARRLAPDFFFHDQVYRADGESLDLPPGEYTVEYTRGPGDIFVETQTITVPDGRDAAARTSISSGGFIRRRGIGSRAIITFTRPAVRTTTVRPKA